MIVKGLLRCIIQVLDESRITSPMHDEITYPWYMNQVVEKMQLIVRSHWRFVSQLLNKNPHKFKT